MITPGKDHPEAAVRGFAPFLVEASEVLASSLDYETTLSSVADLAVSNLADWCAIDMLDEDGSIQQLAVTHKDPEKGNWARELRRRSPPDPEAERGVPGVLRSGEPEFHREVTDEMLVAAARDGEHLRVLREVGFTSVMILPLVARGRTLGAITLVLAESGRRYDDGDLRMAEDLARRAALAVDNARLYQEAQEEIAERKRIEHELRESEERLSRIVETNADGIVMVDREGRITFANAAAEKIFGLGRDGITARTYDDPRWKITTADGGYFPEEGLPFARVLRTGESVYGVELALERPDESRATLAVNGAPLRDAEGDVTGMVASFGDITERKRSEEELRRRDAISEAVRFAAERLLRQTGTWEESVQEVLERLGQATGVSRVYVFENYTTDEGELWATNTHEWVAQGVTAQIDNPVLQALPYKAAAFSRWAEIFAQGETRYGHVRDLPEVERREPEAEGTLSYVLVPVFVEGAWWGFMGFDECVCERDFSATELGALKAAADNLGAAIGRKRAEEELRESQRTLATLMSNLPGMAYRCRNDPEWTMDFVSEGCSELTGHAPDDLIGNRRVSYSDLIHADDRETVWKTVQAGIEEQRPFELTYRMTAASGEPKWVWEQGRGIFSSERELLSVEGFVTDVTELFRARLLLEQRVESLTRIATELTIDQPMETTLCSLAASVVEASTGEGSSVVLIDEASDALSMAGLHGLPDGFAEALEASWRAGAKSPVLRAFHEREPLLVRDARRLLLADPLYARAHPFVQEIPWDTVLIVPLIFGGRALGAISVYYLPEQEPTEEQTIFLGAVADQTAVVVENARLFAAAQGKAALEERQRLARELHDSISQALYGIALGAKTARTWLDRDPGRVAVPLDYVLSLADAGMAEMRALIFELRPESLESEGLMIALEKQAASVGARHGIEVHASLCDEPEVSLKVKEALFRIAQEAVHNAVKHARATTIGLSLEAGVEAIELEVSDDGSGFDPSGDFPGHLGLRSMRERAECHGGTLEVKSVLGRGTLIRVRIPA